MQYEYPADILVFQSMRYFSTDRDRNWTETIGEVNDFHFYHIETQWKMLQKMKSRSKRSRNAHCDEKIPVFIFMSMELN